MKMFFIVSSVLVFAVAVMASSGESLYSGCKGCHGSDGSKRALGASNPLKGQTKEDIISKLKGYKNGTYGGSKKAIMFGKASALSDEDMNVLAEYISKF